MVFAGEVDTCALYFGANYTRAIFLLPIVEVGRTAMRNGWATRNGGESEAMGEKGMLHITQTKIGYWLIWTCGCLLREMFYMEKFSHIEHSHRVRDKERWAEGETNNHSHINQLQTGNEQREFKLIKKRQSGYEITEANRWFVECAAQQLENAKEWKQIFLYHFSVHQNHVDVSDANRKNTHKNFTQFKSMLVCQLIEQVSVWIM